MPRPGTPKRKLIIGGVVVFALLAMLAVIVALLNVDRFKPDVEAAASAALRMDVKIDGALSASLFPGMKLHVKDVHIRNRDTELAYLRDADLGMHLLPLLRKEIQYSTIAVEGARIYLERDKDGVYNYFRPPPPGGTRPLDLPRVTFTDMTFTFADKSTANGGGGGFEASPCDGELTDLTHPGGAPLLKRVTVKGEFACRALSSKTKNASDLKFNVVAVDGVFDFKPLTLQAYGGEGSGVVHMDRSPDVPTIDVNFQLKKFHIEQYFKAKKSGRSVTGLMDFSTTLNMRGRTRGDLRKSAKGTMTLSGHDLVLHGMDLDKELPKLASTQDFSLVDLGAVLLGGPVGLAVTKGYEFTSLANPDAGDTKIRTVVSTWNVDKGVAYAKDVALTTPENRLAMKGGLDFVNNQYQDAVIALVDERGCERVRQHIVGPFSKPATDASSLLIPVGPILKLIDKARTLLNGKIQCEPFYTGTLPAPKVASTTAPSAAPTKP